MELSKRLQAITDLVIPCHCLADIGCDHGYVSIHLVQDQICKKVIAMDVRRGPLEKAIQHIEQANLTDFIEARLSDGAKMLQYGEVDGLICAGMGGRLTVSILKESLEKVSAMNQLTLQPQSELWLVRQYLKIIGFEIDREDIIFEDGKYYPMFHAVNQKQPKAINEKISDEKYLFGEPTLEDKFGPCLLRDRRPVFLEFLNKELNKYNEILAKLEKTDLADKRLVEVTSEIEAIRGALFNGQ